MLARTPKPTTMELIDRLGDELAAKGPLGSTVEHEERLPGVDHRGRIYDQPTFTAAFLARQKARGGEMSDFRDQVIAALKDAHRIIEGLSPVVGDDDDDDIAVCAQNGMQQRCAFIVEQMIGNVLAGRPAGQDVLTVVRHDLARARANG